MPAELHEILNLHKEENNNKDINLEYLNAIPRKVDLLFLCVFYGLYKTKNLPPDIDPDRYKPADTNSGIELGTYRFTVKVDRRISLLRHTLFLLWVSKQPDIPKDMIDFREKIYSFLDKILDSRYIQKVVIPFYLIKAAEIDNEGISYIKKLKESMHIFYEISIFSPENINIDYIATKKKFEEEINKNLIIWKNL